jgi:hypothetical protein
MGDLRPWGIGGAMAWQACVRFVNVFPKMIRHKLVSANLGQDFRTLSDSVCGAEEAGEDGLHGLLRDVG